MDRATTLRNEAVALQLPRLEPFRAKRERKERRGKSWKEKGKVRFGAGVWSASDRRGYAALPLRGSPVTRPSRYAALPLRGPPVTRLSRYAALPLRGSPVTRPSRYAALPLPGSPVTRLSRYAALPLRGPPVTRPSRYPALPLRGPPVTWLSRYAALPLRGSPVTRLSRYAALPLRGSPVTRLSRYAALPLPESGHLPAERTHRGYASPAAGQEKQAPLESVITPDLHRGARGGKRDEGGRKREAFQVFIRGVLKGWERAVIVCLCLSVIRQPASPAVRIWR